MARRKTLPESVLTKHGVSERLAALRAEFFGERGGPELARRLGLPIRTWYNYEGGVTVPAEVILKIIEMTSVEPVWLLHGHGPKYRRSNQEFATESVVVPGTSVGALLQTALELLESGQRGDSGGTRGGPRWFGNLNQDESLEGRPNLETGAEGTRTEPLTPSGRPRDTARSEWVEAQRENRCIRVSGNAMAPIVADGAHVAFAKAEEPAAELDGKLVVTLIDGHPIVRWFHHHGRFAVLHAANSSSDAAEIVIDLEEKSQKQWFRRVLWINTPH